MISRVRCNIVESSQLEKNSSPLRRPFEESLNAPLLPILLGTCSKGFLDVLAGGNLSEPRPNAWQRLLPFSVQVSFEWALVIPGTRAAQHREISLPKLEKILPCIRYNRLRMQTAWGPEQVSHTHSLAWSPLDLAGVRMKPSTTALMKCLPTQKLYLPSCRSHSFSSPHHGQAYLYDSTSLSILGYFSASSSHKWNLKVICSLLRLIIILGIRAFPFVLSLHARVKSPRPALL